MELLCTGILEYASGPASSSEATEPGQVREEILKLYEGLGKRSDHDILGVAAGASAADLKAAYFRLARRYHPDVLHQPGMAGLREKVEAVFFRVNDAYRALSAPRPRHAWEASNRPPRDRPTPSRSRPCWARDGSSSRTARPGRPPPSSRRWPPARTAGCAPGPACSWGASG